MTVVKLCCHTYTGNEVCFCVGRVVERSLCALWIQCGFGEIVDFRWRVNTWLRMGVLDGATVGVAWPFPSGLASGPLRASLQALAATPVR